MFIKKLISGIYPALPTAYDNTLSFYELIAKITNKVNEIIQAFSELKIPTKTSELENDSGYITEAQVGAVTSVNDQIGDVVLDAEDVGALPDTTVIPTKVSELENDAGYVTAAQQGGVTSVNGESGIVVLDATDVGALPSNTPIHNIPSGGTSGQILAKASGSDYDAEWITAPSGGGAVDSVNGKTGVVVLDAEDVGALPDDTTIPTKTSDLVNDSGFITQAPVASVNGETGAVVLDASDVGALPTSTFIPSATNNNPQMDGVANCGSSTDYARADHVHPRDNTKADADSVHSIPIGGQTGYVLGKNSAANYDVSWIPVSAGSGSIALVYESTNPISAIGAHNVTINNLSQYDFLIVQHYNRIVGFSNISIIVPSTVNGNLFGGSYDQSATNHNMIGTRWYNINGNTIEFDMGYSIANPTDMANNQACIPYRIWGVIM